MNGWCTVLGLVFLALGMGLIADSIERIICAARKDKFGAIVELLGAVAGMLSCALGVVLLYAGVMV